MVYKVSHFGDPPAAALSLGCQGALSSVTGSELGGESAEWESMATHSNILSWGIPWTEEPRRLQFMGSQRVRNNTIMTDF